MLERLKTEGVNSPTDAVLTVDIGRINDFVQAKLLQPIKSNVLNSNNPKQYRDKDGL